MAAAAREHRGERDDVRSIPRDSLRHSLAERFAHVRAYSEKLAIGLSDADATVQSMPDASPAKWHLAHTTWFFETFVARDHVDGHTPYDPRFAFLFNSYYEAEGARQPRAERGLVTRPSLDEVLRWRAQVTSTILEALPRLPARALDLVELGIAHEEQHQELLVTDILDLLARNPLEPAYGQPPPPARVGAQAWVRHEGGVVRIGAQAQGFAFDCERPAHDVLLRPFALSSRLVTNRDWLLFVAEGGYGDARLWLADGWAWVQRERIRAPLRWRGEGRSWSEYGPGGWRDLDPDAPVAHVAFYEASAFAAWAGARLPTEQEWEAASADPALDGLFGQRWQWTSSAFLPYPGFRAAAGAVGEYNGKFMCGQSVLRGSSAFTPAGHSRASYRNFFYPHQRWQLTGVRLARDV